MRTPRQTPPPGDHVSPTFDAYRQTAFEYNGASDVSLSQAAGQPGSMENQCAGLVSATVQDVANGKSPDLMGATDRLHDQLADPATRQQTIGRINAQHEASRYFFNAEVPGHEVHPGEDDLTDGHDLVDEMRSQFSVRHTSSDARGSEEYTFGEVTLQMGNGGTDDHAIVVQRLNPSSDYRHDEYQLYDPNYGAFRYQTFDQLGSALNSLYDNGYPTLGGVTNARTTYFADTSTYRPYTDLSPDAPAVLPGNLTLGNAAGAQPGHWQVPPDAQLPPPPDFDQPGPSGWEGHSHSELKRSAGNADPGEPSVLYRPSPLSPDQVKQNQGFFADGTSLKNVNLDAHDAAVSGNTGATDSAGYLGTYSSPEVAQKKFNAMGLNSGYMYDVAPSPNMIDVSGSLGSGHARASGNGEVAAMGGIDWTQVRGWREIKDGKTQPYTANTDYRWDVYDQTHTAGAQPQLAHFSPDNLAWGDDTHKPFVTQFQQDGKMLYRPNEDPSLMEARFYGNARAKVARDAYFQSRGLDYRGPVTIRPIWDNDYGGGAVRLNAFTSDSGTVASVDRTRGPNSNDQMRMGDDGRIHLAIDYSSVLRIGSDGNASFGSAPTDPNSTNGVFTYAQGNGLQHEEDGKWFTEDSARFTPYVARPDEANGKLSERQQWRFLDPQEHVVFPPRPRAQFKGGMVGTGEQLYRFYRDSDSALPAGSTQFVTAVPDNSAPSDHRFRSYMDHVKPGESAAAAKWLGQHNAAWLFKDGFYAVPVGDNTLEVRTLGGKPVWRGSVDAFGNSGHRPLVDSMDSDYTVPDLPWQQVLENEKRNAALYGRAS